VSILLLAVFLAIGAFGAGLLGALTGLGGGLVVVPMMTLVFHIDLRYAIGASLVSVIATSSGAAAAYVREGFTNVRVGIFLEVATTTGALVGAALAGFIPTNALAVLFGLVLLYTAYRSFQTREEHSIDGPSDPLAMRLRLNSTYPTADGLRAYTVQGVKAGFGLMFAAGILSALLGIGSGIVKVLAMDRSMKLPFKVSTTTSNFMIGVTAAASAGIYLARGYVDPGLAFPVMIGVLSGSLLGARILMQSRDFVLRTVFAIVIVALGIEMMVSGWRGRI
jgi:uncharacterized protein